MSSDNDEKSSQVSQMEKLERLVVCPLCAGTAISSADMVSNISRCRSCGYFFDNPRPTLVALKEYYSQPAKYDGWLQDFEQRKRLWNRRLKKILRHKNHGSILDIGAGIGQFLNAAQHYFTTVCGTEISESAIAIAKDKYGIDLISGSIEEIDLGERMFDIITIFHVLEHVHDPLKIIAICRRHLNSGGIICIAVPNEICSVRKRVRGLIKQLAGKLGNERFKTVGKFGLSRIALDGTQDEIHLSHFTQPVLKGFLKKAGFTVEESGLDPYFVARGFRSVFENLWYKENNMIHLLSGRNFYETIWIIARKS